MRREFKQIRFFSPSSNNNSPGVSLSGLIDGTAFTDFIPLSLLGVRALPGTKFYLNGGSDPVLIGFSGLFNIDLGDGGGSITEIRFDSASLLRIILNDSAYLIVDMLGMREA